MSNLVVGLVSAATNRLAKLASLKYYSCIVLFLQRFCFVFVVVWKLFNVFTSFYLYIHAKNIEVKCLHKQKTRRQKQIQKMKFKNKTKQKTTRSPHNIFRH